MPFINGLGTENLHHMIRKNENTFSCVP